MTHFSDSLPSASRRDRGPKFPLGDNISYHGAWGVFLCQLFSVQLYFNYFPVYLQQLNCFTDFFRCQGPYRTGLLLMTPGWLQWLDGRDPEIWWKQTPARANAQYKIIGPSITHVMLHTIKSTRVQIKWFMEISHVSSSHETCLNNKPKYFRLYRVAEGW